MLSRWPRFRTSSPRSLGGSRRSRLATTTIAAAIAVSLVPTARAGNLMFVNGGFTTSSFDISGTNGTAIQSSLATVVTATAGTSGMAWNVGESALYQLVPAAKSIVAVSLTGSTTTVVGPSSWDAAGLGTSGFFGLAIDASGNMYFSDFTNGRIMKSTPQGVITAAATGATQPFNVAVDRVGTVWFTEPLNNRYASIGLGGSLNYTNLASARALTFDSNNIGYIIQDGVNQITKRLPDGTSSVFATYSANGPVANGIGCDNLDRIIGFVSGNAFLGEPNTLRMYDTSGTQLTSWTSTTSMMAVPPVAVPEPSSIALTSLGALALGAGAIRRSRKTRAAASGPAA